MGLPEWRDICPSNKTIELKSAHEECDLVCVYVLAYKASKIHVQILAQMNVVSQSVSIITFQLTTWTTH